MRKLKQTPLIYFPEREGKIAQDVRVLSQDKRRHADIRAHDPAEFLADPELTREIIDGTQMRVEWLSRVLQLEGTDFYGHFSNYEKYESLAVFHPKLKPVEQMKENLREYKSRYEEGLAVMGFRPGSRERR